MSQATGFFLILVTIVLSLMAISRPMWAFGLWMLMWSLEQLLQTFLPFLQTNGIYFNAFVAFIVALASMKRMSLPNANFLSYFNATTVCICLLYFAGLLGLAWTPGLEYAKGQIIWLGPYIIVGVFLAPHLVQKLSDINELRWVLLFGGTGIAVAMLLNPNLGFYGDRSFIHFGSQRGNPLELAQLGATITVVAILSRDSGKTGILLALRIAAIIFGLGIALKSGTRGQVIAAVLVLGAIYPISNAKKGFGQSVLTVVSLGVMGLFMLIAIQVFVGSENLNRWSFESLSSGTQGRFYFIKEYLLTFMANPAAWPFGFGTMAFSVVVPQAGVAFCENLFVESLTEQGLIGGVLMTCILVNTIRHAKYLVQNAPNFKERTSAVTLCGLLMMSFIIAAKSYNLWTGFHFFYLCIVISKLGIVLSEQVASGELEFTDYDEYDEYDEEYFEDEFEDDSLVHPA